MSEPTVARRIVDVLDRGGVRLAFTVPGESFLEILDSLADSPIRVVTTRHEAGAGFMAEAAGQLTGRPAAVLVTRAVGAANAAIALHTARQDSAPLVCLCGQVTTAHRGREAFQEVDLVASFGSLCKAAVEVSDPRAAATEIERLLDAATTGRPGPVLASLPEDVLAMPGPEPEPARPKAPRPAPDREAVARVLARIGRARRPVILAGAGVLRANAGRALEAFSAAWALPVIASWRRPDVFPNDDPRYLGMAGLAAPHTVRDRLGDADVILLLGCRLSEITSFGYEIPATGTELLHVDVEPGFRGDRAEPRLALASDASAFLEAALAIDPPVGPARRWDRATAADRAAYLRSIALPRIQPGEPVHPASVIAALSAVLPPNGVVTTDAGNFAGWAARHLTLPRGARFLGPTSGAMGYALPAAIGASLAARDVTAVALAGDGGFAMLMAELETAVREDARVAVLVFDNGLYGTIRMYQERAHPGRTPGTAIGRIDLAAVARACGAHAVTVTHDADVDAAVADAVRGAGVRVVHVITDPSITSIDTPPATPTIAG